MESLVEIIAHNAVSIPEKTAVIADDITLDYSQLWGKIKAFSVHLGECGVSKGDCVLLHALPTSSFVVSLFAIHLAGGIAVPIDRNAPIENLKELLDKTEAKIFITPQKIEADCQIIDAGMVTEMPPMVSDREIRLPDGGQSADLFFTTGTTGTAKGVEFSHRALIAVAENLISGVQPSPDLVYLVYGPLNHVFTIRKVYYMLVNGSTVVLLDGLLNIKKFFSYIERYHVSALHILPSAAKILFKLTGDKLGDYSEQIEVVESGTAPISEVDKERLCTLLPKSKLYFGYGCSESDSLSKLEFSRYRGYANCVGRLTKNTTLIIVDEDRKAIQSSANSPGFIASKGPMNMKGYWKDPGSTDEVLSEGFIYTNDIGYFDDDGFLYVLGRDGDVINVGGIKVSSGEIENFAAQYPHIVDCACIPIDDDMSGQVPKLFVVMDDEKNFSAAAIKEFLSKNLETYKLPRMIVSVVDIPRSYNGKILKNRLR